MAIPIPAIQRLSRKAVLSAAWRRGWYERAGVVLAGQGAVLALVFAIGALDMLRQSPLQRSGRGDGGGLAELLGHALGLLSLAPAAWGIALLMSGWGIAKGKRDALLPVFPVVHLCAVTALVNWIVAPGHGFLPGLTASDQGLTLVWLLGCVAVGVVALPVSAVLRETWFDVGLKASRVNPWRYIWHAAYAIPLFLLTESYCANARPKSPEAVAARQLATEAAKGPRRRAMWALMERGIEAETTGSQMPDDTGAGFIKIGPSEDVDELRRRGTESTSALLGWSSKCRTGAALGGRPGCGPAETRGGLLLLAAVGERAAVPELVAWLGTETAEAAARCNAIRGLGALGEAATTDKVLPLLARRFDGGESCIAAVATRPSTAAVEVLASYVRAPLASPPGGAGLPRDVTRGLEVLARWDREDARTAVYSLLRSSSLRGRGAVWRVLARSGVAVGTDVLREGVYALEHKEGSDAEKDVCDVFIHTAVALGDSSLPTRVRNTWDCVAHGEEAEILRIMRERYGDRDSPVDAGVW